MKRGEIWWVKFDFSIAGEIQKTRPAIIISNAFFNNIYNMVQVIPLTSNITKCYPCEAYVLVGDAKSKAMADQIMTISKERLGIKIGQISSKNMKEVERAIKVQLFQDLYVRRLDKII